MNRLAGETSPYLRQHRHQPVDWYPWGPEAFAAAAARNCPVLLSVGYSSCHWCHVMAHESFDDPEVAAVMNELFVNVKVDREERPDVDAVYMDAVQALTGRGGWPMTVFLTPEGKPFYGGTYYPKQGFLGLMRAIDDAWHTRRDEIDQNVAGLIEAVGHTARLEPGTDLPGTAEVERAVTALLQAFDHRWGGFGTAPKFPSTLHLELLLRAYVHQGSAALAEAITTSLDAMASGGIHDHLGGGFARYSVDEKWLVPHFEKMLHDQALLLRVYTRAWQVFGHQRWRQVAAELVEYVLRDLRHQQGGFFSAEDADSLDEHGRSREGAFYLWTPKQVRDVLGDSADAVIAWYGLTEAGNFEGANILNRMHERGQLVRPPEVELARRQLLAARARRPRPGLDDKVLTEWNALFLGALAEAAAAFAEPAWLDAAVANGEFLVARLRRADGRWHRSWQADGGARHDALAADLAALTDAFTRLGEATGQARWVGLAAATADGLLERFWDVDRGGVFTTADDAEQLVVRQKDVIDGATPSANSTTAIALYRLAALTGEQRYEQHADQILRLLAPQFSRMPAGFTQALAAVDLRRTGLTEVVIVGERPDLVRAVQHRYLPDIVLAWGEPFPSPLWDGRREGFAYVCRDHTCRAPAATESELADRLAAR